jgi:hypothetical protein
LYLIPQVACNGRDDPPSVSDVRWPQYSDGFKAIFPDYPGYNRPMQMLGLSVSGRCASYLPLKPARMRIAAPGGFFPPPPCR